MGWLTEPLCIYISIADSEVKFSMIEDKCVRKFVMNPNDDITYVYEPLLDFLSSNINMPWYE